MANNSIFSPLKSNSFVVFMIIRKRCQILENYWNSQSFHVFCHSISPWKSFLIHSMFEWVDQGLWFGSFVFSYLKDILFLFFYIKYIVANNMLDLIFYITYVSTGDKWKKRRRLLTPAFHYGILEDFAEVFQEQAKIFVDTLEVGSEIYLTFSL